jgi:hypothetical protein
MMVLIENFKGQSRAAAIFELALKVTLLVYSLLKLYVVSSL